MSISFLKEQLNKRAQNKNLRTLRQVPDAVELIDFASNDYLGFAKKNFNSSGLSGSGASRLITGNYKEIEVLEEQFAKSHGYESALIYGSGYGANTGLLSSLATKDAFFILDEEVHASIKDGVRLGFGKSTKFKHNSLESLKEKLEFKSDKKFVVVESVYSMSGSVAPLKEISKLCKEKNAYLIVDEAHSIGVYGEHGQGLTHELKIDNEVFAKVIAFGKAYGAQGACVLSSKTLKEFQVNFSRPFIYSTAPTPILINLLSSRLDLIRKASFERVKLFELSSIFNKLASNLNIDTSSSSPIKFIQIGDNAKAKKLAKILQDNGYAIFPILSPTVKKGFEGLRIVLHAYNNEEELKELFSILQEGENEFR